MMCRKSRLGVLSASLIAGLGLLLALTLLGKATAAETGICAVPSASYATIQSAVDDPSCTTVEVGAGTFAENVTISRTVSIAGQGALTTTVDGNGSGSVFYIVENSAVVTLTGFTIANGTQGVGNWGTLTVENSHVTGNSAPFRCGGILNGGTLTLNWSTVSGNSAGAQGGGICNEDEGAAIINDSIIISNSVTGIDSGNGGGGVISFGNITMTNSAVVSNSGYQGGGIYTQESLLTLNNSTVISNSAVGEGGGIYNQDGSVTLSYSTVTSNTASFGGAIYNRGGITVTIDHSTLSHNSGFYAGSGLYNEYSSDLVSIEHSTLSDNSGFWGNGSIYNENRKLCWRPTR